MFSGIFVDQLPLVSVPTNADNTQRQALVVSVGYHRILSRYWDFGLTYNFTQQDNGDTPFFESFNNKGSTNSNAVFLTLTRNFNLFGLPAENAATDIRRGSRDLFAPAAPIRTPELNGGR